MGLCVESVTITPNPAYTSQDVLVEVELYALYPEENLYPEEELYPGEALF